MLDWDEYAWSRDLDHAHSAAVDLRSTSKRLPEGSSRPFARVVDRAPRCGGLEVILGAYVPLHSMAATGSVSLAWWSLVMNPSDR